MINTSTNEQGLDGVRGGVRYESKLFTLKQHHIFHRSSVHAISNRQSRIGSHIEEMYSNKGSRVSSVFGGAKTKTAHF
jgi:carbonic anhydrase